MELLWSVSADHSCFHMRHPANFTICSHIAPCITLYIYYPMAKPLKSSITRRLLKTLLLSVYLANKIFKHAYNHVFLHTCVRLLIESKIRVLNVKLVQALQFRNSTKRCYIEFFACSVIFLYYIKRTGQSYYMCDHLFIPQRIFYIW